MAIFESLGINATVFLQFAIFVVTISFLAIAVFKPYASSLEMRDQKTIGGEEKATELHKQSVELHQEFENKAREISGQIKTIFDSYREQANKEYETIVTRARTESQKSIEEVRRKVSAELGDAVKKAKAEAPLIAQSMTAKLLAKEGPRA